MEPLQEIPFVVLRAILEEGNVVKLPLSFPLFAVTRMVFALERLRCCAALVAVLGVGGGYRY